MVRRMTKGERECMNRQIQKEIAAENAYNNRTGLSRTPSRKKPKKKTKLSGFSLYPEGASLY